MLHKQEVDRDGVTWTYRLLLGRDPEDESVYTRYAKLRHMADLRGQVWTSLEFLSRYKQIGDPKAPSLPMDTVPVSPEAVKWGYAILFERPVENRATEQAHLKAKTVGSLRKSLLGSQEFRERYVRALRGR